MKKTGIKAIMRAIINKQARRDVQAVTQDIAQEHDVRVMTLLDDDVKLTYDDVCHCWAFETEVYATVDDHHIRFRVEGLLHDSGDIDMMHIYDSYNDREVWGLFDDDMVEDPTRQMVYETLVA